MVQINSGQDELWRPLLREDWCEAIKTRRSRRRFSSPPLASLNNWLWQVCRRFRPFPDAEAVLVNRPAEIILTGAIGPYGKIRGAQSFIALMGSSTGTHVFEQVGYTGEGIVLEATACGLNSCWVGGTFRRDGVGPMAGIHRGERVYGVIPIGYGAPSRCFTEKLLTGFGRTHRRKPLSQLLTVGSEDELPTWVRASLEAGRLAPSAFNRQPWRFSATENSIAVSLDSDGLDFGVSKRIDCGIAMLHIELGALSQGVTGKWEFLPDPQVARFTKNA
jgi:hypothetical protein